MKAETRLKKIMALPDGPVKKSKLFIFCCKVPGHCTLWNIAKAESDRLHAAGIKYAGQAELDKKVEDKNAKIRKELFGDNPL